MTVAGDDASVPMAGGKPGSEQPARAKGDDRPQPQMGAKRVDGNRRSFITPDVATPPLDAQLPLAARERVADHGNCALLVVDLQVRFPL